jgi:uncharacterized membrane protein YeiB
MSFAEGVSAAPVTSSARVGELDVLRGFALLGVLVVNITSWMTAAPTTRGIPLPSGTNKPKGALP